VHVDATSIDFDDPSVALVEIRGTAGHEAALIVRTPKGTTLVVNDIIANMPDRKGFGGWLLRMFGFTGAGPRVPGIVKRKIVEDRSALRSQLEAWSTLTPLRRVIVSHGAPIEREPHVALRRLAGSLGA